MCTQVIPRWMYARRAANCGSWGDAGPIGSPRHHFAPPDDMQDFGGGSFGVRRPLRFLAHRLQLDETQVRELARILDTLKTERAQAEVDRRRTMSAFAEAVSGENFDEARAAEGAGLRAQGAERLRDAVVTALRGIHALLDASQREQLTYLIRTGSLQL